MLDAMYCMMKLKQTKKKTREKEEAEIPESFRLAGGGRTSGMY